MGGGGISYVLEVKFLYGRVILLCRWAIKADGFNEQLTLDVNCRLSFQEGQRELGVVLDCPCGSLADLKAPSLLGYCQIYSDRSFRLGCQSFTTGELGTMKAS